MVKTIVAQVKELQQMSLAELQEKWLEVFGVETKQRDREAMWRRLAMKIQEYHFGEDEDPMPVPKPQKTRRSNRRPARDPRLPMPGSVITRSYKDQEIAVKVLEKGFEFEGRRYRSLSAIAREITGTAWNGFSFFGLSKKGKR